MPSFSALWRTALCSSLLCLGLLAVASPPKAAPSSSFDVIVVGSEPEAIISAVAAAQEGAKTLLLTSDPEVGGLFVLGEMNVLDLHIGSVSYQRGLFLKWWNQVGHGGSFDIGQAQQVFEKMLRNAGVEVRLNAVDIKPWLEGARVVGVRYAGGELRAKEVIDGTAGGDFAAAAGALYSVGFAAIGLNARMADTLVFKVDGVNWRELAADVKARGESYARAGQRAAWGAFGGYPQAYTPQERGLRLRGLNLGRQADGAVLVNALLIYGVDPFDPASVADGIHRATLEAPRIVAYLKKGLPGFEHATFAGVARRLYIRDSRHFKALCTLTADDELDNLVTDQDIAAGGYPLDIQSMASDNYGYVLGKPEIYGVPLCVTVPVGVDGLWVVGKSAGYDPVAASSARVVPLGMAVAEAVGVAAAKSITASLSPAAFATGPGNIAHLRKRLLARGAYLPPVAPRPPVGPYTSPYFPAFRLMLSHLLATGGYDNQPGLADRYNAISYLYLLSNVGRRFFNDPLMGKTLVAAYPRLEGALTPDVALHLTVIAACRLGVCLPADWSSLIAHGLAPRNFPPSGSLNRGEAYALAARIATLVTDKMAYEVKAGSR